MSLPEDRIPSVGLHVLYEPGDGESTLVDVVFVHGFGGHPVRSWQYDDRPANGTRTRADPITRNGSLKRLLRRTKSVDRKLKSTVGATATQNNPWQPEPNASSLVFWPRDLLSMVCSEARIITWGYHTLRSGGMPVNAQPNLFSHASDLSRELQALRGGTNGQHRPLIFITHSLGGIIVKEVLRQAEFSHRNSEQDILRFTAAVIFFGCPHRATAHEPLADTAISMAEECLRVKAESSVLSDLCGVKSPRWGETQDSFLRLWYHFNFLVKTYQERQRGTDKLTSNHAESSKIGDKREDAESLPGDHRTMCQFRSVNDEGFKSLSKILRDIVRDEKLKRRGLTIGELDCLRRLVAHRVKGCRLPTTESSLVTCRRICSTNEFCDWYRRHGGSNERMLWLTGRSGSGKSTQLRHIRDQMEKRWGSATTSVIYCTAEGRSLDRVFASESKIGEAVNDADLTRFFLDDYITSWPRTLSRRTFILVDAGDGCDDVYIQELVHCLCQMARSSNFSVCLASRSTSDHVPANITRLKLESHNFEDILWLVQSCLRINWEGRLVVIKKIAEKAGGSFSWAQLATNVLNKVIDGGGARETVDQVLGGLPTNLYGLYEWILGNLSPDEKTDATTVMRWVMLSPEPMVLNDLRMAVRLDRTNSQLCCDPQKALDVGLPSLIQELQKPGKQFDTPSQFYQWLCSRTCGLLEARPTNDGSKAQQSLGLQHIYPINNSVRSFFLSGRGFTVLSPGRSAKSADRDTVELCHYSLLHTILTYLNTSDLSPLVSGYHSPEPKQSVPSLETLPMRRRNVADQRSLITSSYPFLGYAVDNLLYHLLSPRPLRYFLPQHAVFMMFASNNCRIWRRWTALLGETDALAILARCKSAEGFLQPEFGASFRLERVFRAVDRLATGGGWLPPHKSPGPSVSAGLRHSEEDEAARRKLWRRAPVPPSTPPPTRTIRRGPRSRGTLVVTRRS
ncbi:hypothetical protein F4802DRAFT_240315 [Xylaria palmicola]|nr:hypothetical protein F4802DRAFT_240315 [Xylaria palmicola]